MLQFATEPRKQELRTACKTRLSQSPYPVLEFRKHLQQVYTESSLFASSDYLVGFVPMQSEPDIMPLLAYWLASDRRLFLPCFEKESGVYQLAAVPNLDSGTLVSGKYGILEPAAYLPRFTPPFSIEGQGIWLVPGVAFSETGARLGHGGGYYDRLLCSPGIKVGIAYDVSVIPSIPVQKHDVFMDYLLTETRFIPCSQAAKLPLQKEGKYL